MGSNAAADAKLHRVNHLLKRLNIFFQVPFREAHGLSGAAVQAAENKGCPLNELTVDDLKEVR